MSGAVSSEYGAGQKCSFWLTFCSYLCALFCSWCDFVTSSVPIIADPDLQVLLFTLLCWVLGSVSSILIFLWETPPHVARNLGSAWCVAGNSHLTLTWNIHGLGLTSRRLATGDNSKDSTDNLAFVPCGILQQQKNLCAKTLFLYLFWGWHLTKQ